jgi:hypothetical protein
MLVYKVDNFEKWNSRKGNVQLMPINSKKGYFLTTNLVDLWPELDWDSLEKIELTDKDLIHEDI